MSATVSMAGVESTTFYASGSLNAAVIDGFDSDLQNWLTQVPQNATRLVIDFANVEFLDSSALVVLVNAYKQAKEQRRELFLSNVSAELKIIFELTQLEKVLNINNLVSPDSANPLPVAA